VARKGTNLLTGELGELCRTHLCFMGFECDTVSRLQQGNKNASRCMELEEGKTGTTGRATLLMVVFWRHAVTVLENSAILGARNIEYIVAYLNNFGFFVYAFQLAAELYKSPSRRLRQFLLILPLSLEPIDQTEKNFKEPPGLADFKAGLEVMQIGPGDPDSVLVDKENIHYTEVILEATENREKQDARPKKAARTSGGSSTDVGLKNVDDWEADHLELFKEVGLDWPPAIQTQDEELYAAVQHLPRRLQEAAFWHCHRKREPSEQKRSFHDLQPTLKFRSQIFEQTNCVVCTSTIVGQMVV